MNPKIQMDEPHYKIAKNILNNYNVKAMVFGSRSKNTAKKFSDLDLVILEPLEKRLFICIKNDFEESNLPYKVDLILWNELDQSFQNHIKNDLIDF